MSKPFLNKVVIVTGTTARHGIGRATAKKFAELGANVVVTDIALTETLVNLSQEISGYGVRSLPIAVDIADESHIRNCVDVVMNEFETIDTLVNNAGSSIGAKPILEILSSDWDTSYAINLKGPAMFCQAVIPIMMKSGGGTIVNNSSTAGLGAETGFGAYSASKHALVALTKTIAAEFGSFGIRCNAVCPGYTNTDMHAAANERLALEAGISVEDMKIRRYAAVAMRRAGSPEEVADVIAYLAGPMSSYITGVAVPISGGTPVGL